MCEHCDKPAKWEIGGVAMCGWHKAEYDKRQEAKQWKRLVEVGRE